MFYIIRNILIILFFLVNPSISAEIKNNLLDKSSKVITENVSNLLPGEGLTEVSIDIRENYKPDISILGVRELKKMDDGNYFTQFSLIKTEQNNDERYVGNLGFGTRRLNNDNTLVTGFNTFIDYDNEGNTRGSIGAEVKNSVLDLSSNYYKKIDNGNNTEEVLDGYDVQLTTQVPYLHWANAFYNQYKWHGVNKADIKGAKYGTELFLTSYMNFEFAYDNKDQTGLKDELYAKLQFIYPPRQGPTFLQSGISSSMWKVEKDMSDQLLTKVKRTNRIMVEFSGIATISRLN